jgi:hypothetical protein
VAGAIVTVAFGATILLMAQQSFRIGRLDARVEAEETARVALGTELEEKGGDPEQVLEDLPSDVQDELEEPVVVEREVPDARLLEAFREFCSVGDRCRGEDGDSPDDADLLRIVDEFCAANPTRCMGEPGTDGEDASPVSDAQLDERIAAFCADDACRGEDGDTPTDEEVLALIQIVCAGLPGGSCEGPPPSVIGPWSYPCGPHKTCTTTCPLDPETMTYPCVTEESRP